MALFMPPRRLTALLTCVFLQLAAAAANACCSSGDGFIPPTDPAMKAAIQRAQAKGIRAISCTRTRQGQERIRQCCIAQRRPGQAAKKKSNHESGKACDMSRQDNAVMSPMKRYTGSGHTGNHYSPNGR